MDAPSPTRLTSIVWIDAREALIARWIDDGVSLERIESDVPSHRRSSGHVRHDPGIRPGGGGGAPATTGEPHRHEHMARFLEAVAARVPEGDLELIGPGTTHEHLASVVSNRDSHGPRRIEIAASGRLTQPQLVARLRHRVGHAPRRRAVPGTGVGVPH